MSQFDVAMIRKINVGVVVPEIGAQIPRQQWMLFRRIVAEDKDSRCGSRHRRCLPCDVSGQPLRA